MAENVASGSAGAAVEGVFFPIEELERLSALSLNGIVVTVDGTPPPPFEERVLMRLRWAPNLIAASLHKRPDGAVVLTGHEISESGSVPVVEATFDDLDTAVVALREVFRA